MNLLGRKAVVPDGTRHDAASIAWALRVGNSMTLDEMIGARLAIGFPGRRATPGLIQHLRDLRVGTLVVFARNYESPEQFVRLLGDLNHALARTLLVLVDHEGGRVVHFRRGLTPFPDAGTVGRTQAPEDVERQGAIEADELRSLGVRVNLAPCVDVLAEGCDPVIGDRSYGSDPAQVAALAVARIRGLQSHGVAACAKHFPGLGAVPRDPHRVLPTIPLDRRTMEAVHEAPFRAAIEAGVASIMSSHVCYPGLGEPPDLPATFSRRLITDHLRQALRFEGVIMSDDLEMGALRGMGSIGEAAVRTAEAGHDLLLLCSDAGEQKEALAALRQAYGPEGRLPLRELEAAVERIKRFQKKFSS